MHYIQIIECLANELTRQAWWELVKHWHWPKQWSLEKAIGYKNWPMRLNRSVLFVNNKFTVVRDEPTFLIPVGAQMGPNWTFAEMGCVGTHWVNVWMPRALNAANGDVSYDKFDQLHHRKWISTAPRDLLIWFPPDPDRVLQIEKLKKDRTLDSEYNDPHPPPPSSSNSYINLPMRAWYTSRDDWPAGVQKAFTTVLIPHDPMPLNDLQVFTQRISSQDDGRFTALTIPDYTHQREYLIVMQSSNISPRGTDVAVTLPISGQPMNLKTDAEAMLLTYDGSGTPVHVSAWSVSLLSINGQSYLQSSGPISKWEHSF